MQANLCDRGLGHYLGMHPSMIMMIQTLMLDLRACHDAVRNGLCYVKRHYIMYMQYIVYIYIIMILKYYTVFISYTWYSFPLQYDSLIHIANRG